MTASAPGFREAVPATIASSRGTASQDAPWDMWSWDRPAGRVASGLGALAVLAGATALGGPLRPSFWAGLVTPDLAVLARRVASNTGGGRAATDAQMLATYNDLHDVAGPLATVALSALAASHSGAVGGLGWLAHVLIDRAFGFGKRNPDGSIVGAR